jgi:hypothetical protein
MFSQNQEFISGNFLFLDGIILEITNIITKRRYKVKSVSLDDNIIEKSFYYFPYNNNGKEELEKQYRIEKAISQAKRELRACKEFNVDLDNYTDKNIDYALSEWAYFLLNGGSEDQTIKDQRLGIKKKKIDVLEWEYSGNYVTFPAFGCEKAWHYLRNYLVDTSKNTFFSLV